MALREFVDSRQVEWKVWDVTPERMHPVTAREMFVGRYVDFQDGWLADHRISGSTWRWLQPGS